MLPKGLYNHTKFATYFLNMGLTPPPFEQCSKKMRIWWRMSPLIIQSFPPLQLPSGSNMVHRVTSSRREDCADGVHGLAGRDAASVHGLDGGVRNTDYAEIQGCSIQI